MSGEKECCPKFDPEPWRDKEIRWDNKLFVKDHYFSFLHVPLNMPAVIKRSFAKITRADALPKECVLLADEKSPWGSNLYFSVEKDVPEAAMAAISGTFLTRVFEGPYREMRNWIQQMKDDMASKQKTVKQMYFYYTTCPKCAKKYGKNYVVILAQV